MGLTKDDLLLVNRELVALRRQSRSFMDIDLSEFENALSHTANVS